MADLELKPCPFCGSKNVIAYKNAALNWMVKCQECGVQQNPYAHKEKNDAIKAWNRRASHD